MQVDSPYEWGHPQFDGGTYRKWFEFEESETYVDRWGIRYIPAVNLPEDAFKVLQGITAT